LAAQMKWLTGREEAARGRAGRLVAAVSAAAVLLVSCADEPKTRERAKEPGPDLGVDASRLSPVVDNPFIAFSAVRRTVLEGEEIDAETGEPFEVRVESSVRDETTKVAGIEVTVVDVSDFEDGELVEQTEDYYAQHESGDVYYIGERVDDYEGGEIVGHEGQWLSGKDGALAGLFMPADPQEGDEFEQERAPGVAEDSSRVLATGVSVTVPAGKFDDCIETEDVDPISGAKQNKFYCRGVGLVREVFPDGGSIDLIEFEPA
jgi:hypothetical protein